MILARVSNLELMVNSAWCAAPFQPFDDKSPRPDFFILDDLIDNRSEGIRSQNAYHNWRIRLSKSGRRPFHKFRKIENEAGLNQIFRGIGRVPGLCKGLGSPTQRNTERNDQNSHSSQHQFNRPLVANSLKSRTSINLKFHSNTSKNAALNYGWGGIYEIRHKFQVPVIQQVLAANGQFQTCNRPPAQVRIQRVVTWQSQTGKVVHKSKSRVLLKMLGQVDGRPQIPLMTRA